MVVLDTLDKYKLGEPDYETARKNLLIHAKNFYDGREMIINGFRNKIFPLSPENIPEYKGRDEGESDDGFFTPREFFFILKI